MRIMVKKDGDNVNIRPHINSIKENLKSKQAKKESKKESKTPKGSSSKKKKSLKPKKFGPHAPLSGGRWITVTDESSPLHGRHLYINSSGTILAGAVPQSMHGQKLGDLHKPHKGHKGVHNDLSDMNEKQLESIKEQANGLHGKLGEDHVVGQSAKILHDIADHYHMKAQAKAGIPHPKEKELHAKMKEMSPKELHSMAHDLDASEAEHDISKHYLTQKMMTDAPHPHMEWTHEDAQGMSVNQLKQEFDDNMKNIKDPDFQDEASQSYIKNANAIYNHYLTNLHGEKPYWGKVPHYGEAKYDGTIQSLKKKSLAELHEYQQELFKHYQNGQASDEHAKNLNEITNHFIQAKGGDASPLPKKKPTSPVHTEDLPGANKTLAGADKSDLAVWMSLQDKLINGGSHISPAIKEKAQKKKEVAEFYLDHLNETGKTWAESNGIENKSKLDVDKINGEATVGGKLKGGHGVDNGDGTVNFTFNGTHNGSSGTHTVTMPKEKFSAHADVTGAMDAFNHGKITVSTDHPHVGKNIGDYGITADGHVGWHTPIDHDGQGHSAEQLKELGHKMTQLIYYGDQNGNTNHDSVDAKKKVQKNLGDALHTNENFLKLSAAILGYGKYDTDLAETAEEKKSLAHKAVREIISNWAGTSANSNPLAIAVQLAAQEEFGSAGANIWYSDSVQKSAHTGYLNEHKEGLKAFLREQYNQTQKFFKDNGITHVPIIRGMSFSSKEEMKGITMNEVVKQNIALQPLSSFTSNPGTADTFTGTVTGGGGKYKILSAAMIPVERILGCPQTGFGCMNEQELVVIGPKEKNHDQFVTKAWSTYSGTGLSSYDLYKHLADFTGDKAKVAPKLDVSDKKKEKAPAKLKKPTKDYYHLAPYSNHVTQAVNAKHVVNDHGIDAFVHKVGNGYKISEGSTGKGITGAYKTQKAAIEVFHKMLQAHPQKIKDAVASTPKLSHEFTKSLRKKAEAVIHADKDLHNADWLKKTYDGYPVGSPEFNNWLKNTGYTMDKFKQLPAYKHMQMKKSVEEKGYYPSQRHAYKTNHKDPIYLPLNRLKTPYQTGKALDQDKIKENIAKINAGQSLAPVVIGYDYDLHDGHHRLEAAKACGHSHVPCVVGGRNERRTKAAEKRYRSVYKSVIKDGRLLVKKVADEDIDIITDHKWITVRGSRVLIHKETGKVVSDHPTLKGKTLVMKDKKEEVKKSMTKSFIDKVGRLLFRK
jgi:hypothetical protein